MKKVARAKCAQSATLVGLVSAEMKETSEVFKTSEVCVKKQFSEDSVCHIDTAFYTSCDQLYSK